MVSPSVRVVPSPQPDPSDFEEGFGQDFPPQSGRRPDTQATGLTQTRAHRVAGYEHVADTNVPHSDRLIIDRPVVEIRAGQDATMVRKLCHRLRCSGALKIIWRGYQPHVDAPELVA